jgi:hypothetical protein
LQYRTAGSQVTQKLIELMPGLTLAVLSTRTSTLKVEPTVEAGMVVVLVVPESTTLRTGAVSALIKRMVAPKRDKVRMIPHTKQSKFLRFRQFTFSNITQVFCKRYAMCDTIQFAKQTNALLVPQEVIGSEIIFTFTK